MKLITVLWLSMLLTPVAGQYPATPKVSQIMTFSYPMESGGIMYLSPTTPLPETKGTVRVDRGSVAIDIDLLVEPLPPAQSLGANFNTYVVWLIAPDGEISNLGELRLNGASGILHATTTWGAFGIFVTAEPDNCGKCPGTVVLANDVCVSGLRPARLATIVCPSAPIRCSNGRSSTEAPIRTHSVRE
jgi:hypothetical protein